MPQPKTHTSHGKPVLEMVKKLRAGGLGRVEIAKQLGISAGTADYMLKKLKSEDGCTDRKKGSGRPRTAGTPEKIQEVTDIARRGPKVSIRKVAAETKMPRT